MTPAARVAAAIEILDDILSGTAVEKAVTGWGRSHRFAGSKDRAAIRDHVFDALRCRQSYGWIGGSTTGRGIMLGAARSAGNVDAVFTGEGYAPAPVTDGEAGAAIADAPRDVRLDMPDWLLPHFDDALGPDADAVIAQLQSRAGVFLRVNIARISREDAQAMLREEDITTEPVADIKTALQVTANERKVAMSKAYQSGVVDLQDPSSQAAIAALGIQPGQRVLDYCAGGGGKSLAMAALGASVTAHDIDTRRMADITPRAARANVDIETVATADLAGLAPFDLVLCDAPCSGSGTWRRTPAAKWDLTPDRLADLTHMQDNVLAQAAPLVRAGGILAYATCSVLNVENIERVQRFMDQTSSFEPAGGLSIRAHDHGDGFFLSILRRTSA